MTDQVKRPRRGNNEGSIRERKDRGNWEAQVMIQGKRVTKTFETRTEAQKWVREMHNHSDAGLTFSNARLTVQEALDKWLESGKGNWQLKTHSRYSEVVRLHIVPHLKPKLKLMDVKPDHVEAILKAVKDKGVGVRSQKYILSTMHKFFADLIVKRVILYNPAVGIKITYKPPEMLTLSRDQVKLFLKAAAGNRHEHLFYLAFVTGMRQGELLGLKWSDIDETSQSLMVQRQVQWVDHHTDKETPRFFFKSPKSKAGIRRIPVGQEAIKRLKQQRGQVVMQKMVNADKWQENDLVFPNLMGNPIDPNNLIKDLRKLLSETGLPAIRFHDIRHTCATLLLLKNVHPKVVCERLGHSDIRITLERYSHAIPSLQNEAAQMIEGLLGDDPVLSPNPSQAALQPKTDVLDI